MSNIHSDEKLELEKQLFKMRIVLYTAEFHMFATSFCMILFLPILNIMSALDRNIGIYLSNSIEYKIENFETMINEFNSMVEKYNSTSII